MTVGGGDGCNSVAIAVVFFVLSAALVAALSRLYRHATMVTVMLIVSAVISALLLCYLFYALLRPDKLG